MADQCVRDQGPLELASRELADTGIAKASSINGLEHLVDQLAAASRRKRDAEPVAVDPESHQVPRPQGHVRVEPDALGDIADGPVATRTRMAGEEHLACRRCLQPENHPEYGRLAGAVGPDEAGDLAGMETEPDVVEDLPAGEPERHTFERADLLTTCAGCEGVGHKCSVETLSTTAL